MTVWEPTDKVSPPAATEEQPAFRSRLSTRHAFFTVLVALVVGFASSVVELFSSLHDERARIDETVHLVIDMVREPATSAAYALDASLAQHIADGVIGHRGMILVAILDDFGNPLAKATRAPLDERLAAVVDYLVAPIPPYEIALTYSNDLMERSFAVGSLRIHVDSAVILANLRGNLSRLVYTSMIHAIVLAAIIATFFHFLTTMPLLRLARGFAEVGPDRPIHQLVTVPSGHGKDELGVIARAANRLIMAFQSSLEERDRIGEELRQLANALERRVEDRTAELREKSLLLETSVEAMAEGISVIDADLKLSLWNSKFIEIFGLPADLVAVGLPAETMIRYLVGQGDHPQSGQRDDLVAQWMAELRSRDHTPFRWTRTTGTVIDTRRNHMANGSIVSTYADVTRQAQFEDELRRAKDLAEKTLDELRRTQISLVQAEKMASLGSLVAGVAHELNTPLGNMLMVASTLEGRLGDFTAQVKSGALQRSVLDKFLEDNLLAARMLAHEAEHAAELIGNFKQIAVDQSSLRRRTFDLATVVRETLSSLHNKLKKTPISVDLDIPDGIIMDNHPGPIEQILTNFIINSLTHAFDDGEKGVIRIKARAEGDRLALIYEDDGHGMSDDVAKHAFDPFFTTKFGQGGSGLGLYIVFNLATGVLNGTLHLTTRPGSGTRFDLSFPLNAPADKAVENALQQ